MCIRSVGLLKCDAVTSMSFGADALRKEEEEEEEGVLGSDQISSRTATNFAALGHVSARARSLVKTEKRGEGRQE